MLTGILESVIQSTTEGDEVALLLSGGVDSISCGIASERIGKKVTAYTFHLEGDPTYDSNKAVEASKVFGWECKVIEVPTDRIRKDFERLRDQFGCIKKVHYECVFPFMYIYPEIREKIVVTGLAADGHYGLSKKACMHYKDRMDEFRGEYFKQESPAGWKQLLLLSESQNLKTVAPYLDSRILQFFEGKNWDELNRPRQKNHIRTEYAEYFDKLGVVKPHLNLQLVAKIPALFETLLDDPEINFRKRIRIMDICRDWTKKVKQDRLMEIARTARTR